MKKPFPFYPLLLAAFPVVAVYALNLAMVPLDDVWRPLGVALAGSAILWTLLSLLLRSAVKGALLTATVLALFFSFGPTGRALGQLPVLIADVLVLGAVAVVIVRTRREYLHLTRVLNFGACVLVLLPLAQILTKRPPGQSQTYLEVTLPVKATAADTPEKPDIFFIIVDGYGRADQLERVIGYSNEGFIGELRQRGFFVADSSRSNYCQTQLSVASTLNLSFLQDFRKVFPEGSDDRRPLVTALDKSFVSNYLKKLGYTYVAVTSGFNEIKFPSADLRYDKPLSLTMIESALVQLTPITTSQGGLDSQFDEKRNSLNGAIDNLTHLAVPTSRPRFIVAHVLAPHPPFVFDANGNPVRQRVPFAFWDGSHYMGMGGTAQSYREGYSGQVQYLNKRLLPMIDALISKGRTKPVIIIEGDHGSKLGLDQESLAHTDVRECFANLMAFYVPDSVRGELSPDMTSVNTFRILLNGLFHEKLPLLPNRSFYSAFSVPYRFTDVTEQTAH